MLTIKKYLLLKQLTGSVEIKFSDKNKFNSVYSIIKIDETYCRVSWLTTDIYGSIGIEGITFSWVSVIEKIYLGDWILI
jgi:hypothetical protein